MAAGSCRARNDDRGRSRRSGRTPSAQHRADRGRRPRLRGPHAARPRHRRRAGADPQHRLDRARGRRLHGRLRRQRHLRAVARRHHDRPLRDPLRLRVHADAQAVHAGRDAVRTQGCDPAPRGLLRRRRTGPTGLRRHGSAGHRDHAGAVAAGRRLPHRADRQMAPRRQPAVQTLRARLPRVAVAAACRLDVPAGGRSARRQRALRRGPHRPVPLRGGALGRALQRRTVVQARPLPHRLPHGPRRARHRGEPQPSVLPLSRLQRAAHPAAGDARGLRCARGHPGPPPAGVRRHGPLARPQCRTRAGIAARRGARPRHAGDLHQRQRCAALCRPPGAQRPAARLEGQLLRGRHPRADADALAGRTAHGCDLRRTGGPCRHLRHRRRGGGRPAAHRPRHRRRRPAAVRARREGRTAA